jgi:hypothetical protein
MCAVMAYKTTTAVVLLLLLLLLLLPLLILLNFHLAESECETIREYIIFHFPPFLPVNVWNRRNALSFESRGVEMRKWVALAVSGERGGHATRT